MEGVKSSTSNLGTSLDNEFELGIEKDREITKNAIRC